MKIGKKIKDLKEKIVGIDNHLSMNWKHILGDSACVRKSSRGIKIELGQRKEQNRQKHAEKQLAVLLKSFTMDE